jgi:hypothetical protein
MAVVACVTDCRTRQIDAAHFRSDRVLRKAGAQRMASDDGRPMYIMEPRLSASPPSACVCRVGANHA